MCACFCGGFGFRSWPPLCFSTLCCFWCALGASGWSRQSWCMVCVGAHHVCCQINYLGHPAATIMHTQQAKTLAWNSVAFSIYSPSWGQPTHPDPLLFQIGNNIENYGWPCSSCTGSTCGRWCPDCHVCTREKNSLTGFVYGADLSSFCIAHGMSKPVAGILVWHFLWVCVLCHFAASGIMHFLHVQYTQHVRWLKWAAVMHQSL